MRKRALLLGIGDLMLLALLPCCVRSTVAVLPSPSLPPATRIATPCPTSITELSRTPTPTETPTPVATLTETPTPAPTLTATPARVAAQVSRVVDGDTIEVNIAGRAYTVRYIGIDAPEAYGTTVERMAPEASAANEALVAGKTVYLEQDQSDTDKQGRLLRYVFVADLMVNAELVRQGYAWVRIYPPDVKYQSLFARMEQEARVAGRGLWASTPTATLSGTPQPGTCPQGCITPPPGCLIKGNINKSGERIYHVPGGQYYDKTTIDPSTGERWFCTEEEAIANGWRKSKR